MKTPPNCKEDTFVLTLIFEPNMSQLFPCKSYASNEGAGYLRWLGNKISEQFKQGKQPSAMEEYALMVVHDLQSKGAL